MATEIIVVETIDHKDKFHKWIYWCSKTNEQMNKWIKLGIAVKDRIWIQQRYIYMLASCYTSNILAIAPAQNNIIEIMDMMKEHRTTSLK